MKKTGWLGFIAGPIGLRSAGPIDRKPARAWLVRTALGALVCLPVLAAATGGWAQSTQFRLEDVLEDVRAALLDSTRAGAAQQQDRLSDQDRQSDSVSALADYAASLSGPDRAPLPAGHPVQGAAGQDAAGKDKLYTTLLDYVQQLDGGRPILVGADQPQNHAAVPRDDTHSALLGFVQKIESQAEPREPRIELAKVEKAKSVKSKAAVAPDDEATFVGQQVCMGCHASHAAAFGQTVMGRIFRNPRTAQEKGGCETCHGAGSAHVKAGGGRGVGGIISFRKDDTSRPVADNNAICLSCHDKGGRIYWQGSTHESRDVACTNCHTVMSKVSVKGQLKKESEAETCYQCHKDRRMQAQRSSHMPLREGKLTCTSCHNPHGSASDAMLKEASVNDNCYKCHAEKRGPFLWEHPPVRENCLNCHEAHGSNNENLLKVQRPRLCQDCHSAGHASQSPLVNTAFNRSCNNCHSQIHGSNHPSGVLFQR
jgi:DmsE family decaheme c-type cytochrome